MRTGLDTSNWSKAPTAAWDSLLELGYSILFPQAIDPPRGYPPGCTAEQIRWALEHGWQVAPYIWKWFGTGLDDVRRRLDLLTPFTGQLDALVLDVEDTFIGALHGLVATAPIPAGHQVRIDMQPPPEHVAKLASAASVSLQARLDELAAAYEILDAFPTKVGVPALHYTGRWYHVPYLGDTDAFSGRGLHVAAYDGVYDPAVFQRFGGWTDAAVKQPYGTMTAGLVGNVDPDVVADWALVVPSPDPQPDPQPEPDPETGAVDWPWQAKRPRLIQIGGELRTVADQLESTATDADAVRILARGVRDRADEILS